MKLAFSLALITAAAFVAPAAAQSNVSPVDSFAWAENLGWTNWHDAGETTGAQGAHIHSTFLSGFVWAENVGWINLGDGSPADGEYYANQTGEDFGVNRDPDTGELFGGAWGENIGWINFEGGGLMETPNPARIDSANGTCRLAGWAWGENVGWINLDDTDAYVALLPGACAPAGCGDLDGNGQINLIDFFTFSICFGGSAAPPSPDCPPGVDADCDGDGDVDLIDFQTFAINFTG